MNFKSFVDLEKYINSNTNDILKKEVKEVVEKEFKEHIKEDVYDAYTPIDYTRRPTGGLSDESNILSEITEKNKLSVMNIAPPNNRHHKFYGKTALSHFIEEGTLFGEAGERPFVSNTIKNLKENQKIKQAMKNGFKKRGIKTI